MPTHIFQSEVHLGAQLYRATKRVSTLSWFSSVFPPPANTGPCPNSSLHLSTTLISLTPPNPNSHALHSIHLHFPPFIPLPSSVHLSPLSPHVFIPHSFPSSLLHFIISVHLYLYYAINLSKSKAILVWSLLENAE